MKLNLEDYSGLRGVNYVPSYALNTVEIWRDFDAVCVDRELGYAERMGINSVRIFLQYHVYEHDPRCFLRNLEIFVGLAHRHGMNVMPAVFDGCFSVAPSITTTHWWVASPGGPRTNPGFYPQGERFCRDLVDLFRGDPRILMWDAMNEPEAVTFYVGEETAYAFARHFAEYLKEIDGTHPVTVGMAHAEDNRHVADVVDVISFHPYASSREELTARLRRAREVADGRPVIASETGQPFFGCPYELVLPFFREEGIPSYFWQLMIGRDCLASTGGVVYPDGTIRRLTHVEAVMGRKPEGFVKKPDAEGVPLAPAQGPSTLCLNEARVLAATPICDDDAWNRLTFLWAAANPMTIASEEAKRLSAQVCELRGLMEEGRKSEAYPRIDALISESLSFHWSGRPIFHPDVETCLDEEGSA